MTKNNMKFRQLLTRCTAVPVAFVGLALNAFADNKVTIEDFSIKLNEEKTVAIYLENTDAIAALQMDIILPEGLTFVENSLVRNEERLDRDTHSLMMNGINGSNRDFRVLIVPSSMDNIEGNSGAIAYFTVKADEFNGNGDIRIENIVGSRLPDGSADTKVEVTSDVTTVSPYAGFVQMGAEALEIKTDGTSKKVDVQLTNHITVRNMEAVITLPAGLSFEMNEKGKPKFDYGTRLPQNATISSNVMADGSMKVVIAGVTTQPFEGNEGTVFSFYVKADETLAQNSEIVISDVLVTDNGANANAYVIDEVAKQAVVNSYITYFDPAIKVVDELQGRFDAAVEKINTEAPTVKDSVLVTDSIAKVGAQVENLRKAVEQAYQDETLAENSETVLAPVANIDQAIEEMVGYALALEQGLVNNEAAYQRLTAEIAAAQTELDAATEKINTECAAVAAQFTETLAGIKTQIDALTADVKAQYEAGKLTAESTVDLTAVKEATTKVVADAAAAQAVVDANEAAYERLSAEIAAVQTQLDSTKKTIETECAAVAEDYVATLESLQSEIDGAFADLKKQYDAVALNENSKVYLNGIISGINKALKDAQAGQAAVEANQAAYERLTAVIAVVQKQLDDAKNKIETEYADVADQFKETAQTIQIQINTLTADLQNRYEAGKLTAESTVETSLIEGAITKMLADASGNQAAVIANEAAYKRLTAEIATVQTQLDNAKKTIETECADVAANYVAALESLQSDIDGISADVKKQYEAVSLNENSKVYLSAITSGIATALKDAQAAQAAFDANEAAVAANEAAYERLNAEIAAVQTELDNAKTTIETEYAAVAAQFENTIAGIQSQIKAIADDVKAQYEAVKLTADSKVDLT